MNNKNPNGTSTRKIQAFGLILVACLFSSVGSIPVFGQSLYTPVATPNPAAAPNTVAPNPAATPTTAAASNTVAPNTAAASTNIAAPSTAAIPATVPTTNKPTVSKAPPLAPSKAWKRLLPHKASFQEGIVIEHEDGTSFVAINDSKPIFNPASNTKLATSLAVLRKFGPEHTFVTEVRIAGSVEGEGELKGDLYVTGNDMLFGDRQARELAQILADHKIKSITGDVYVSSDFSMNLVSTGATAGRQLLHVLDPWYQKRHQGVNLHAALPQVLIQGSLKIGAAPKESTLLVTHTSPPLRDMLKIMLCFSDNTMAQRFGDMIGGPEGLTSFVRSELGIPADEVHFASTSGLDVNRVSPRAMLTILKALRAEVETHGMQLTDILAVAGVDQSTLKKRFTGEFAGTVVGKTGTLTDTDHGVSALAGEVHTKKGTFLFVIFEIHGSYSQFRVRQNMLVQQFEEDYGGPAKLPYTSFLDRIDHEDKWSQ